MQKIPDMGFNDKGEVNTEVVIAQKPDVLIAQLRAKPALEGSGVVSRLKDANIPVLYIDTFLQPVKNTPASVDILGLVLNKEKEAKAYTDFYNTRLSDIQKTTAKLKINHVFLLKPKRAQMVAIAAASPITTQVGVG